MDSIKKEKNKNKTIKTTHQKDKFKNNNYKLN